MGVEKRDFDKEAAAWDENPVRVKLADDVAAAIVDEARPSPDMDAMDFGCGTGLLTLRLYPLVRSITGVDSSHGMLDVLKAKIETRHLENVRAKFLDITQGDVLMGSHSLIVSSMTLHHVQDTRGLLRGFHDVMLPGGLLCIADLDLDEGKFHDSSEGVFHNGFDRSELRRDFAESGFVDIRHRTAAEVMKPGSDGNVRSFSVFVMIGTRQ